MPVQVDLAELRAIDSRSVFRTLRVVPIDDEQQRFPGRLEAVLELAVWRAEYKRIRSQGSAPLQNRGEPPSWIERDAAVLGVFRVDASNDDLMLRPIDIAVLNAQHLALATAGLEGANDPVVHARTDPFVFGRIHRQACREKRLFFVSVNPSVSFRLVARSDADTETMERRRGE